MLISPEQSGFVEGRQIFDGVVLVHEVLHSLKSSRIPGMMIKLDIAKAYDKLNRDFMEKMLGAYGFSPGWVEWVMSLVSSPFYNILLNGSSTSSFQESRGIH